MALAQQALTPLPTVPGVILTCHVAVWYWAAQEAQARNLTGTKAPLTTLQRIAAMPAGPQNAMMALPHIATINLTLALPPLPARGHVLRWASGATHSAIVTGPDAITGYNQGQQFPAVAGNAGRTVCRRNEVHVAHGVCAILSENDIVHAAGVVFNL